MQLKPSTTTLRLKQTLRRIRNKPCRPSTKLSIHSLTIKLKQSSSKQHTLKHAVKFKSVIVKCKFPCLYNSWLCSPGGITCTHGNVKQGITLHKSRVITKHGCLNNYSKLHLVPSVSSTLNVDFADVLLQTKIVECISY